MLYTRGLARTAETDGESSLFKIWRKFFSDLLTNMNAKSDDRGKLTVEAAVRYFEKCKYRHINAKCCVSFVQSRVTFRDYDSATMAAVSSAWSALIDQFHLWCTGN